ncbi:MAG: DUF456 family protein [Gemmatimonadota bacterium]|nr:DUF456 family protein [Gemmatimonadota bacterium]
MDTSALALVGLALMAVALLLIPLGLPGIWIMILVVAGGVWAGEVGAGLFLALLLLGLAAELAEWLAVDRLGRRHGGSRRTFWGALLGGIAGALVGVPVPIAGPLLGIFAGTFAGATLATWLESRDGQGALRAGWGATLGRAAAVAIKVAAGLVILVTGGAALLF